MSKQTTRRAVLAGAAALPALSLPALAKPADCSFPDLAAEFAEFYPRWAAATLKSAEDLDLFTDTMFKETGLPRDQWPAYGTPGHDDLEAIIHRVHKQLPQDPVDKEGCSIIWNELHDQLFPLVEEILAQQARTVADLAVQAQAFAMREEEYWTSPEMYDDDRRKVTVNLVTSLCKFCGVSPLPGLEKLFAAQIAD